MKVNLSKMIPKEVKEMNIWKYRITAILKIETDVITSIIVVASPLGPASSDISDNVRRDLYSWCYCFYWYRHNVCDVTLIDNFQ